MMPQAIPNRGAVLQAALERALGLKLSSRHSPFRAIGTADDALIALRDSTAVFCVLALTQVSLRLLIGVSNFMDAAVYLPLAYVVYRFHSRVVSALLVLFALWALTLLLFGPSWGANAGENAALGVIMLWAGLRSFQATRKLHQTGEAAAITESGARFSVPAPSTGFAWAALALVGLAFVLVSPNLVAHVPGTTRKEVGRGTGRDSPPLGNSLSVSIGSEQVSLRPPEGFTEARQDLPEIGAEAEKFVPPAMNLLALFVSPDDLEKFRRKRELSFTQYVMIEAVRGQDQERISGESFREAKADRETAGAGRWQRLMGADPTLSQWLEAALRKSGELVQLGSSRLRSEGVLDETERSISFGSVLEDGAAPAQAGQNRVVVTSFVLANGKLLVVYTYGTVSKADDIASTHGVARQMIRNLVNDNPA